MRTFKGSRGFQYLWTYHKWSITFTKIFKRRWHARSFKLDKQKGEWVFLITISFGRFFLYTRRGYYPAMKIKGRIKTWGKSCPVS